jgi:hypothetical protein
MLPFSKFSLSWKENMMQIAYRVLFGAVNSILIKPFYLRKVREN